MENIPTNLVIGLAAALELTDKKDVFRLIRRCGFTNKGYLDRLNLNGFGIKGVKNISEYTKHLSVLDIRNNPELTEIKISVLCDLGFALTHENEYCCSEMLMKDDGQTVTVSEPGHDPDESPFARYFMKEDPEITHHSQDNDDAGHKEVTVADISEEDLKNDISALTCEIDIEESLLRTARIGMNLSSCLQSNLDRTNIGMFDSGLDQLMMLALRFERIKTINEMIVDIHKGLAPDASEDDMIVACRKKAQSFWNEQSDGVSLADLLEPRENDVPVNAHNFGKDGVELIKSVQRKGVEEYYKARGIARDYYLIGSSYGGSNLRLSIHKFADRALELANSIDSLKEIISAYENELKTR